MPVTVRRVQPKHLYRKPLPDGIKNELHAVAVFSLAGAIRQISSLAKHAESMLGELCDAMSEINTRTILLDSRVNRLKKNIIPFLDVDDEAGVTFVDYLETEPFTSEHDISQQILSIHTAPEALLQSYISCDPAPKLHQFTPLFNDGRNAMHLYSNPEFFFTSWRQSMVDEAKKPRNPETNIPATDMTEESTAVDIVLTESPGGNRKLNKTESYSSTLPSRGRSKGDKSKTAAIQVYNSVRDRKNQKRRSVLRDDMFERSEVSSGYLSQHSSYNSLLDNDSAGSIGSQEGKYLGTTPPSNGLIPLSKIQKSASENTSITYQQGGGVSQDITDSSSGDGSSLTQPSSAIPNGRPPIALDPEDTDKAHSSQGSLNSSDSGGSGKQKSGPKVLHKMRSSDTGKKSTGAKKMEPGSPTIVEGSVHKSPRKGSVPLPITNNADMVMKSPRKDSAPTPMTVSPGASPEIKRRAESIAQQMMQQQTTSPELDTHQRRHSGVFQFPDPLEVLSSSQSFESNIVKISPDDFPPIDSEVISQLTQNSTADNQLQLSPQRERLKTHSGVTSRRRAPSPPKKRNSRSDTVSISSTSKTSLTIDLPASLKTSPPACRHSNQSSEGSPRTPKRRAPPPPTSNAPPPPPSTATITSIMKTEQQTTATGTGGDAGQSKKGQPNDKEVHFETQRSTDSTKQQVQHPQSQTPHQSTEASGGKTATTPTNESTSPKAFTNNTQQKQYQVKSPAPVRPSVQQLAQQLAETNPIIMPADQTQRVRAKSLSQATTRRSSEDDQSQSPRVRSGSVSKNKPPMGGPEQMSHTSTDSSVVPQSRSRVGSSSTSRNSNPSPDQQQISPKTPTQSRPPRLRFGSGSKSMDPADQNKPKTPPTQSQQSPRSRFGSGSSKKDQLADQAQARGRIPSGSSDSGSSNRYSSFSESDKIAEMLRAKAKQRKQKSEEKKKKNANQILKSSGVDTSITNERSELLRAIRKGIDLKNVRNQQELVKKQSANMPWDVAAILERRQALETTSDTEHDDGAVHEAEWEDM